MQAIGDKIILEILILYFIYVANAVLWGLWILTMMKFQKSRMPVLMRNSNNSKDLPSLYSKINLGVALFDCILFWLWGHSIVRIFYWFIYTFEVIRVAIAILLCMGVKERNLLKCKIFCIAEFVLLCLALLFLIFDFAPIAYIVWAVLFLILDFSSIAHVIWSLLVIAIRLYGIRMIGRFIRILQSELGESALFPWKCFQEPVQVQDKFNANLEQQIP